MKFQALADSEDDIICIEFGENHSKLSSTVSPLTCVNGDIDSAPEGNSTEDGEGFISNEPHSNGDQLPFMVIIAFSVNYGTLF